MHCASNPGRDIGEGEEKEEEKSILQQSLRLIFEGFKNGKREQRCINIPLRNILLLESSRKQTMVDKYSAKKCYVIQRFEKWGKANRGG